MSQYLVFSDTKFPLCCMGDKKALNRINNFQIYIKKFPFEARLCVKSSLFGENILVCPQQNFLYIIIIHSLTYVLKDST